MKKLIIILLSFILFSSPVIAQVTKIANVEQLRKRKGSNNAIVELQGYYNPNDGGGQQVFWKANSTKADNGGTVFQVAGVSVGRWESLNPYFIRVKMFGAKGNGSYNDTQHIQKATDFVYNNGYGIDSTRHIPIVYIDTGEFRATTINLYNGVRIRGNGEGGNSLLGYTIYNVQSEIHQIQGTNNHLFIVNAANSTTQFVHGLEISGLSLRGNWSGLSDFTNITGSAIYFPPSVEGLNGTTPGQSVKLENLTIENFPESGLDFNRNALPGMIRNIWGRYLKKYLLDIKTSESPVGTKRISHLFFADNIQGDYIGTALVKLDYAVSVNSYLFSNIKHEIDPLFGGKTFIFNDCDNANITVMNCNTIASTSVGSVSIDEIYRIQGTGTPRLKIINNAFNPFAPVTGTMYLINDTVNNRTVSGNVQNYDYNTDEYVTGGSLFIDNINNTAKGLVLSASTAAISPRLWFKTQSGTGTTIYKDAAGLVFATGSTPNLTSGSAKLVMDDTGVFYPASTNIADLGKSGNKFKDLHLGNKLLIASSADTGQQLQVTGEAIIKTGSIEVSDLTKGVILKSPNGTRWLIKVNDSGVLTTTAQ